jgi:putative addiction module component (TIGR02574 family)
MTPEQINAMPIDERLRLIEAIWDSIDAEQLPELTDAQKAELDKRLGAYEKNPASAIPWEEVKTRAQARLIATSRCRR